jgi:ribosomal protein L11 methyltransferase
LASPREYNQLVDGETAIHYSPEPMSSNYIEVCIRADIEAGELIARLQDGESLGGWEKDGAIYIYWPENKWSFGALEDLKRAMTAMGVDEKEANLTIQEIPDKDWNATWAASLHPIRLGRRIRIRQSWHSSEPDFDGIELIIDPQRAFGTGYHATTQLVIEWLEDHIHGGERILDVGTGSGILGMTALRLGAASALAIDTDPVAVECAREYSRINGFGPELNLRVSSFETLDPEEFDIVVANLDGKTLPQFCDILPGLLKRSGIACLSGLQLPDYKEISGALAKANLRIQSRFEREEWLALTVLRA